MKAIPVPMQIADLINTNGLSGSQITHGLKVLGDGDMQKGLIRIAKFFLYEGKSFTKVTRLHGIAEGAASATFILLIAKLIYDRLQKSKQQDEAKAIWDAFKDHRHLEEGQESDSHEEGAPSNNNINPEVEA